MVLLEDMQELPTRDEARHLDQADPLSAFRARFHIPQHDGEDAMYFTGNSLGLQPKRAAEALQVELKIGPPTAWKAISKDAILGQLPRAVHLWAVPSDRRQTARSRGHERPDGQPPPPARQLLPSLRSPKEIDVRGQSLSQRPLRLCSQIRMHGGDPRRTSSRSPQGKESTSSAKKTGWERLRKPATNLPP